MRQRMALDQHVPRQDATRRSFRERPTAELDVRDGKAELTRELRGDLLRPVLAAYPATAAGPDLLEEPQLPGRVAQPDLGLLAELLGLLERPRCGVDGGERCHRSMLAPTS